MVVLRLVWEQEDAHLTTLSDSIAQLCSVTATLVQLSSQNSSLAGLAKEQTRLRADFDKLLKDHVRLKKDYNELKLARPLPASPATTDSSKRLRQVLCGGDGIQEESPESPQRQAPQTPTTTIGMSLSTATAFVQYNEDDEEEYTNNPFEDSGGGAAFPIYKCALTDKSTRSRLHSGARQSGSSKRT
ncbi:hypothetical protein BASA81_000187 [Batrachochytrium salamandrivorans]|nr:hypothetical protein BASA81_000187 [Batrachochytrium salamandrivorans]